MNETLKKLVAEHGLAAVLAGLRMVVTAEVAEIEEIGDPADAWTLVVLEEVADLVLDAAAKYDAISTVA